MYNYFPTKRVFIEFCISQYQIYMAIKWYKIQYIWINELTTIRLLVLDSVDRRLDFEKSTCLNFFRVQFYSNMYIDVV